MNLLWDTVSAVAGANSVESSQNHMAADTINSLCVRVANSESVEDRRDSVRALRALANEYQLEVGTQSMDILVQVLKNDRDEISIVHYALETFTLIFATQQVDESHQPSENDIGVGFTEIFVKKTEYVKELVELLTLEDFQVRQNVVYILSKLLANRGSNLQEAILAVPQGVSMLMDLLDDPRPPMRNDVLLLLIRLTRSNSSIQQIVVFENAFGRLFDILETAGGITNSDIVVQDSLLLMNNLLKTNISNQNHFRETCCIRKCNSFLKTLLTANTRFTLSKQDNVNYLRLLSVLRVLLVQSNPNVSMNQAAFLKQGTFSILKSLTLGEGAHRLPPSLKIQIRCLTADCMRRNMEIQKLFDSGDGSVSISNPELSAPATINTTEAGQETPAAVPTVNESPGTVADKYYPGVDILITDLLNTHSSFQHRAASLYCLSAYLSYFPEFQQNFIRKVFYPKPKDENKQSSLVPTPQQTPLANEDGMPPTTPVMDSSSNLDIMSEPFGLILDRDPFAFINAFRNTEDVMSMWLSCLALSYAVRGGGPGASDDATENKKLLLNATIENVNFMEKISQMFLYYGAHKFRVWCSGLILLSSLLIESPESVNTVLSSYPTIRSFLLQQCQNSQSNIPFLPGLASFVLGLCCIFNDESIEGCKKENILNDITSIIKFDIFKHNIKNLILSKMFTNAAENFEVQSTEQDASDVWFDYEFTVLCKKLKDDVLRYVSQKQQSNLKGNSEQNALAQQYRQLIRAQDDEIQRLQQQITSLLKPENTEQDEVDSMKAEADQLRMELATLQQQQKEEEARLQHEVNEAQEQLNELTDEQNCLLLLLTEQAQIITGFEEMVQAHGIDISTI